MAATARSSPAWSGSTSSAASASGDRGSLVIASVRAPWRRPSRTTSTMSGDCPDWLMPITSASAIAGRAP